MENRFGIKDLFMFLILALLVGVVGLAIKQYDRQWTVIQETREKLLEQTGEIARIRRLVEKIDRNGVAFNAGNPGGAASPHASGNGSATGPSATQTAVSADDGLPPVSAIPVDARVVTNHEAPDYAPGDTIIDVFNTPPDKLTPLIASDQYAQWVQLLVMDSLLDRDPNTFAFLPRLASGWRMSDDGLTIDYRLRPGVTFSDGTPLTADDIVYTFDLVRDERIEDPRDRIYLEKLASVEKLAGGAGVRFKFKEFYFMNFGFVSQFPIMSKKFYSQFTPKQFNESAGLLIGSGPYRLPDPKTWKPEPGKPVELVRNERYWGEPSGPNKIIWRVIELPAARLTEFRNGAIDVFTRPTPEQFELIKNDDKLKSRVSLHSMDVVNGGYLYLGWNQKKEGKPTPFADVRVRQAMTMLIDREAIARDILQGHATVASGPFHHLSPQCDQSIKPWPYDPAAAEKLLGEAGFRKNGGTLVGPDGQPFRFQVLYGASGDVSKRICNYVKDALARAGIIMEPVPSDWSVLLERTKERKYDAVCMGWGGAIDDDPDQMFSTKAMQGTGDNFVQYSNPIVDAAIQKARTTVNEAERNKSWFQVHQLIHQDQPYTFLCNDFELIALDKRFRGAVPTKTAITSKSEWYVPSAVQKYR